MKRLLRPTKGKIALLLALVLVVGLGAWLLSRVGEGGWNPLADLVLSLSEDTRYAPGYSHEAFYAVGPGDREDRVRDLLGPPLDVQETEPWIGWVYSDGPIPEYEASGELPGTRSFTEFRFDASGEVKGVWGQLFLARRRGFLSVSVSGAIGDGKNYLGLSNARIEELEGKSREEIESLYGKPASVHESKVATWLRYSDSPSSTHYRQRVIGFSPEGHVVRIRDDIYWD